MKYNLIVNISTVVELLLYVVQKYVYYKKFNYCG